MTVGAKIRIFLTTVFEVMCDLRNLQERNDLLRRKVTTPAGFHLSMFRYEFESRRIVIEGRPLVELDSRMATRTGLLVGLCFELVFVRRSMAINTEFLFEAWEFIDLLSFHIVTSLTRDLLMGPREWKARLVVKGRIPHDLTLLIQNIPTIGRVARLTRNILEAFVEGRWMRCLVTALAGFLRNAFKEVGTKGIRFIFKLRTALGFMTIKATILFMLPCNGETRLCCMIKFDWLLPRLLAVTGLAILRRRTHLVEDFIAITMVVRVTA